MIDGKPDIEAVLQAEGIDLRQRGRSMWGLCPFHDDRNPSFKVNPDRQTFHCFGCGAHGDAIDFTQRLHNLSFKDALRYLGMTPGKPPQVNPELNRKRELLRDFEQWRRETYRALCDEYNAIWHTLRRCKTMDEIGEYAEVLCEMGPMEDNIEILSGGTDEQRFELYRAGL
ncbi:MAG: hypothetical protein JRE23_15270 [Deltaproteobacteria bacterium]|nr:hypothetical protein [Deltaproteobacteria bacterium]